MSSAIGGVSNIGLVDMALVVMMIHRGETTGHGALVTRALVIRAQSGIDSWAIKLLRIRPSPKVLFDETGRVRYELVLPFSSIAFMIFHIILYGCLLV